MKKKKVIDKVFKTILTLSILHAGLQLSFHTSSSAIASKEN